MKKSSKGIKPLHLLTDIHKKYNDISLFNKRMMQSPYNRKSHRIKLSPFPTSALMQFQDLKPKIERRYRISSVSTSIDTQTGKDKKISITKRKPKLIKDKLTYHSANASFIPMSKKDIYLSLNSLSHDTESAMPSIKTKPVNLKTKLILKDIVNFQQKEKDNDKSSMIVYKVFSSNTIRSKTKQFIEDYKKEIVVQKTKKKKETQFKLLRESFIHVNKSIHSAISKGKSNKVKPDNYAIELMYTQEYPFFFNSKIIYEGMGNVYENRMVKVTQCENKIPIMVGNTFAEKYFELRDQMLSYVKDQFTITFRKEKRNTSIGRTNIDDTNGFLVHIMKNESLFEKEDHFFINSFSIRAWKSEFPETELNITESLCESIIQSKRSNHGYKKKKSKKSQKIERGYSLLKEKEFFSLSTRHKDKKTLYLEKLIKQNDKSFKGKLKVNIFKKLYNIQEPNSSRQLTTYKDELKIITQIPNKIFTQLKNFIYKQDEDSFKLKVIAITFKYNINSLDEKRNTLLNISSQCNLISFVSFLLNRGADPNIGNVYKNTPLHYALSHKNFDMATLLIKYKADENVLNNKDLPPWKCIGESCDK